MSEDTLTALTDAQAILDAGAAFALATEGLLPKHLALVPEGYEIEDIEGQLEAPLATREEISAHTLDGFKAYFNRFVQMGTVIFANPITGQLSAVFDYHESDVPRWGEHVLTYHPTQSRRLGAWKRAEGLMSQTAFAEHIEEHAEDVVEPDAAAVLEMAQHFEAKRSVDFRSSKRLDNGDVQLVYEEETTASAGVKGEMSFPERLTLGIPIHEGGDAFKVEARLRYRLRDGELRMGYKLLRLDDVLEAAAEDVLDAAREMAGDVPVIEASR